MSDDDSPPKPKRESVLEFANLINKAVHVKLDSGRQVAGIMKGYDRKKRNIVLDEAVEFLRDPEDPLKITDKTRSRGLIQCRGIAVAVVSLTDGADEIANPFV